MAYTATALTSPLENTNYNQINALIGQVKDRLLECPLLSLISEVAGSSMVARECILQVGSSSHYLKIRATSYTIMSWHIRNKLNTTDLTTLATTLQSATLYVMWGASNFCIRVGDVFVCGYALCNDSSWSAFYTSTYTPYGRWLLEENDTYRVLFGFSPYTNPDGSITLYNSRITITTGSTRAANDTNDVYPISIFMIGNRYGTASRIVQGTDDKYWLYQYTNNAISAQLWPLF